MGDDQAEMLAICLVTTGMTSLANRSRERSTCVWDRRPESEQADECFQVQFLYLVEQAARDGFR